MMRAHMRRRFLLVALREDTSVSSCATWTPRAPANSRYLVACVTVEREAHTYIERVGETSPTSMWGVQNARTTRGIRTLETQQEPLENLQ